MEQRLSVQLWGSMWAVKVKVQPYGWTYVFMFSTKPTARQVRKAKKYAYRTDQGRLPLVAPTTDIMGSV